MLSELTWKQFKEWMIYEKLEPFTQQRQDYGFAFVASTLLNIYRDVKKKPQPFTLEECLLRFGDAPRPDQRKQSWTEMKQTAQLWSMSYNSEKK